MNINTYKLFFVFFVLFGITITPGFASGRVVTNEAGESRNVDDNQIRYNKGEGFWNVGWDDIQVSDGDAIVRYFVDEDDWNNSPVANSNGSSALSAAAAAGAAGTLDAVSNASSSTSSSNGGSYTSTYSNYGSSSATSQNATAVAKARCMSQDPQPARLRIIVATEDTVTPVSAALWLTSFSGEVDGNVLVGSENRDFESGEINSAEVIQVGSFETYKPLVSSQSAETLGVSGAYENVVYAETGLIESGEYYLNIIIKNNIDGSLKQITQEVSVEPCVHSTVVVEIDADSIEQEEGIEDDVFCFELTDGSKFSGTKEEYIEYLSNSNGTFGIDSMTLGACQEEAATASDNTDNDDGSGESVTSSSSESSSAGSGVGVSISGATGSEASSLLSSNVDLSGISGAESLEEVLDEVGDATAGVQKLIEEADSDEETLRQVNTAALALAQGNKTDVDLQALKDRQFSEEEILEADNLIEEIEEAASKIEAKELFGYFSSSRIVQSIIDASLTDEIESALESGATKIVQKTTDEITSQISSSVSSISSSLANTFLGSIGSSISSIFSSIF